MDHRVFRASSWGTTAGMLNFFLFAAVSIAIGGDALNGGVENGQYYLGGGGYHTPVPYLVFLCSRIYAYTFLLSWPAIIVLSFVSWLTWPQESGIAFGVSPEDPVPTGAIGLLLFRGRTAVWRLVDLLEEGAWLVLDSWRHPDLEVFARHTAPECIAKLRMRVNLSGQDSGPAVFAHFTGSHFQLMRTPKRSTLLLYRGPYSVLVGKLIPRGQGTYVRAWHRFPSASILMIGVFMGLLAATLGIAATTYLFPTPLQLAGPSLAWVVPVALTVLSVAIGASLFTLVIGAWIGERIDEDLQVLVHLALQRPNRAPETMWRTGPA